MVGQRVAGVPLLPALPLLPFFFKLPIQLQICLQTLKHPDTRTSEHSQADMIIPLALLSHALVSIAFKFNFVDPLCSGAHITAKLLCTRKQFSYGQGAPAL